MSDPSERIRAALQRSQSTRQPGTTPPAPILEEAEIEAAPVEEEDEVPVESDEVAADVDIDEQELLDETQEVEETLPLIAESERVRADRWKPEPVSKQAKSPEPVEVATSLSFLAGNVENKPNSSRVPLMIGAGAVVVIAAVFAFTMRSPAPAPAKPSAPSATASSPFRLEVEPQGNGLMNIRWSPQSASIAESKEGQLVIQEGGQQPRIVTLKADELKIGHMSYQATGERVEVRLEVVDRSGATFKESVLALSPKPPATPVAEPQKTPQISPQQEAKAQNVPKATPELAKAVEKPQAVRPVPRTFTPPPVNKRSPDEARVLTLDAPAPVTGLSAAAPAVSLPEPINRLPSPKPAEPLRQIKVGGSLQAANLIKKVTPVYPMVARTARIQGTVQFTAVIGKDGKIQNLKALGGPSILISAATDAVKQWIYRPTLLNGEPVEVLTQIDVAFNLN